MCRYQTINFPACGKFVNPYGKFINPHRKYFFPTQKNKKL